MDLKKCLIAATVVAGALAQPARAEVGISIGIGIPLPPPAVIYEPVPPPPAVGYVWVPGYWGWSGERYVWIRGRHVYGRPGYVWRPDRWDHRGERWHRVSGGWERDRHGNHGRGHGHR
jgi:hypothetical protein